MATHAQRNRYNRDSVQRALDLHRAEYTELSTGNWSVHTGIGYVEMNLRDAYFYVVGLADKDRLQQEARP